MVLGSFTNSYLLNRPFILHLLLANNFGRTHNRAGVEVISDAVNKIAAASGIFIKVAAAKQLLELIRTCWPFAEASINNRA
jgi:hypothetical protein